MSYVEHLVDSPLVACTWEQVATTERHQRVVPDGCLDLVWSGESLTIAGPDTGARLVTLAPGSRIVGARLRPGAAGAVLALPASELRDSSPDAVHVLGSELTEALLEELANGADPHRTLLRALHPPGVSARDPLIQATVAALARPHVQVAQVADELGLSVRQLHRRVSDAVGYGPKVLARVLRFRRLQALAPAPLAELALDAGYADQAHMTAEVTRLAGVSPVRFLKDRTPTAA